MRTIVSLPLLLLVLFTLGACTTPTLQDQPTSEFAPARLYPVQSSGFGQAFVSRNAGLSSYRVLDIQALDFTDVKLNQRVVPGTRRSDWQLTPEREAALQRAWQEAMDRAFNSYGRAGSGDKVLRITARLVSVLPGRPTSTTIGRQLQPPGSTQDAMEIAVEFRLYELAGGELLAVIRDSRTITTIALSRTGPASVDRLFGSWASLLHTRVSGG